MLLHEPLLLVQVMLLLLLLLILKLRVLRGYLQSLCVLVLVLGKGRRLCWRLHVLLTRL